MIPNIVDKPTYNKYFLLEEGDIMLEGDEFYNPMKDQWDKVNDGEKDEDGNYPDAFIGYEYDAQESKPVRRENILYNGELSSYLLAYVLRTTHDDKVTDKDYYEVFCEADEFERTPIQRAENKLSEIQNSYEDGDVELYSWNIAQIVKTSEHYTV